MSLTAIVDVDGTLVDTNYQHTIAWYRAFRHHGVTLPMWRIHRHIGMGGDQIVPALAGEEFAEERGEDVRDTEKECYRELIDEVEPLPGARALLERLKGDGHTIVLASSAKEEELEDYLDMLDARDLADAWTMSADVEATKPEPDLVRAALDKGEASAADAVMVGDSTFDCEAAERAGVRSVAVLSGGFAVQELRESGALAVFDSVEELLDRIDETPFAAPKDG
jgi:HAD superfamily hydrolase (TIGR01509 family)